MTTPAHWTIAGAAREVALEAVVVAGYTGRDRAAVEHHIEELAEIGIPRPVSVPAYWLFPPVLATQDRSITVRGSQTSGEAELCLVVQGDDVFLTVASDHTDRQVESVDIGLSKAICQKPVATEAWPVADLVGRWDDLVLRSWIDEGAGEVLYQDGTAASLAPPLDTLAGLPFKRPGAFVMLCGTVPVIGGIRPASRFRAELHDPGRSRSIQLDYAISTLARFTEGS